MSKKTLADRLREMRKLRGMTQTEVAARAGTSSATISHFETGQREPGPANLKKLADALGVTTDFLLGRTELAPTGPQMQALIRTAARMTQQQLNELARFADFIAGKTRKGGKGSRGR